MALSYAFLARIDLFWRAINVVHAKEAYLSAIRACPFSVAGYVLRAWGRNKHGAVFSAKTALLAVYGLPARRLKKLRPCKLDGSP